MLKRDEHELVTRVGPGTPMGDVMRRYWMPAAPVSELPGPDSDPLRARLLGENLVAFTFKLKADASNDHLLLQAATDVVQGRDPLGSHGEGADVRPAQMYLPEHAKWYETRIMREPVAQF